MEALKKLILDNYKPGLNFRKMLKINKITLEAATSDYSSGIIKQNNKKYYYYIQEYTYDFNTMITTKLDKPIIKIEAIR